MSLPSPRCHVCQRPMYRAYWRMQHIPTPFGWWCPSCCVIQHQDFQWQLRPQEATVKPV
jgi:hypothetical protein